PENGNDRDRRRCVFRCASRSGTAARDDHVDFARDKISGQCEQSIKVTFRPAVFDRYVLSYDITRVLQSLQKRGDKCCIRAGCGAPEEAYYRHRLLLRAGQERMRRRTGENRHESPASHPIPSIRRWDGLWLYRATSGRLDEWRLSNPAEPLPPGAGNGRCGAL